MPSAAEHAKPPPPSSYRADIDGLRAIAVLAVLIYHARFPLPGGFAGVDVFFVISGFLITSIILKDAASADGFRILKFWERRIRRILPALAVVLATTVALGWFVLLPSDFTELGRSVLAQAVFGGNVHFWLSGGYFAQPAIFKPLLHTWSLAVEEQFYLFFPLLFLARRTWTRPQLRWLLGGAFVVSLGLSAGLTRSAPDAAFYLLPSRAWELLGGALLALSPAPAAIPRWLRTAIGAAGLLGLALAFRCFGPDTAFPGVAALLPCAGAAALLWAHDGDGKTSPVAHALSWRPLAFVGKISYSLYLWHWPLLVYGMYWHDYGLISWRLRLGLLGLSVVLAVLSWKFIETPFRTRRALPRRRTLFAFGLAAPAAWALAGCLLVYARGVPSRFPRSVVVCDAARPSGGESRSGGLLPADREAFVRAGRGQFPRFGPATGPAHLLVWGDSHAKALATTLVELARASSSSVEFACCNGTPPIAGFVSQNALGLKEDSARWSQAILDHVAGEHVRNVLLVSRWSMCWELPGAVDRAQPRPEIAAALARTVRRLRESGAEVWILKDVPRQPVDVPKALARALLDGSSTDLGVTSHRAAVASRLEDEIFGPAAAAGAHVLDPVPALFLGRNTCPLLAADHPLYADYDHLTVFGAERLRGLLASLWTTAEAGEKSAPASPAP